MLFILLAMATQARALPVLSVQELPLTLHDIQLIRAGGGSSISTTSTTNHSCLLTPASAAGNGAGSGCTWRTEQRCRRKATARKIPVYSPGCVKEDAGAVVRNCKERMRTVPVVQTTKVCSIQGSRDCLGPCYNCPVFCKKTQQSVCVTSHTVKKQVITSRECETGSSEECEEVLRRVEREMIKLSEDCYNEEVEELCAPVNCKFVNLTKICQEKESSMLVELKERQCTVCEPDLAESEEVEEECHEALTDECASEPFNKPWKKFCSDKQTEMKKFMVDKNVSLVREEPRAQELSAKRKLAGHNFNPEISTKNNFEVKTSKSREQTQILPTGTESLKSSEIDKELINLVRSEEKLIHEELNMIKNLKSKPSNINVNVKYNFVTNPTPSPPPEYTTTVDPILHILETAIELPYQKEDRKTDKKLLKTDSSVPQISTKEVPTTTIPAITTQTSLQPTTKDDQYTTTTPTTRHSLQTTRTTTETLKNRQERTTSKNLSASDFLRMCFKSGIGCDFSQNNFKNKLLTTEPRTTPTQETTSSTPSPSFITTESSSSIRDRLKERVKLCFFSNICNDPSYDKPVIRQPRLILSPTTQRPQKEKSQTRSNTIRAQIQARARACFFEGDCS